ncbi:MAG: MBL fold metallo-hydrolase, partial [candidate division Zixibacteria bacterium]|nr:MBL fold metallo-hydrolase [candidate division Zixibacteria bacterium]
TEKGLVVITGCAHPGIVEILREAKKITNEDIYLVLGGFHLGGVGDSKLRDIIKSFRELGVKKAAPCHCSGDRTRELFKEEYGDDFIANGVGKIIEI